MATQYYVVAGERKDLYLASTKSGSDFAAEGTKVLRIVMGNGDEHLVNFGAHKGARTRKEGVLTLYSSPLDTIWLRSYRDWAFYEEIPYEGPAPVGSTIF